MTSQSPLPPNVETVLLFGSQALSFDENTFRQLSSTVLNSDSHGWVLRAIDDLPGLWDSICEQLPNLKLRTASGAAHLSELGNWFRAGTLGTSTLPNILLSPLVVIAQLVQYASFAESRDPESLPPSETVGFCIGLLSAFAVSSSSRKAEFERHASAAVRIALLVGALVDVQDALDESGESTTLTAAWKISGGEDVINETLSRYPDAYVSVAYDEARVSITTSRRSAPALQQDLVDAGFTVAEIGLCGRFHSQRHAADFADIIKFCDSNSDFALPNATTLKTPTRSNVGKGFVSNGSLHEIALKAILLDKSNWYSTVAEVKSSRLANENARIVCFGPERCIPPSLLRGISAQVLYAEDVAPVLRSANDIAVVGMSINVAGANDADEFWQLLSSGQSQHKPVPHDRFGFDTVFRERDANRAWYGNFIDHHDAFDHKFFKKTPRESASMDPQQRLLMQAAYQAVEQSGYFHTPDADKHIGCYVGLCGTDYDNNIACHQSNAFTATGTLRGFIAGKVSHYFGWTAPSVTVDTACSGSAVAVHQACSAILSGDCTTALAGGTNIMTQPLIFQNLAGASFLSTTGQCKPFDSLADGYCRGEAVAAVFLKKMSVALADGDQILGVISGTAVQQNENCTPIVVPNAPSLSGLFRHVLKRSGLAPEQVTVVEAHGTGTPVGDPAEYESIRRVFGGFPRARPLQLGSVKGLVGHTEGTSGAVSLIKVLMMMQKGFVPPQASFSKMNPSINASPADNMQVSTRLHPWEADFKAALINNYGASGSNASMVVTQGPKQSTILSKVSPAGIKYPFWIAGLDNRSIGAYATRLRRYLKTSTATIADLSFNIARQSNRSFDHGLIFSCRSIAELDEKLAAYEKAGANSPSSSLQPTKPVILCFGGQVSTSITLDRQVYENVAILRKYLDRCDAMAQKLGAGSIFPAVFQKEAIEDIVQLQVALFATQYSTAKSWIDCGVQPAAVVGHSFGELTALAVSGVLSVEDTLKVIIGRATLIRDSWGAEKGSMIAIEADVQEVNNVLAASGTAATIACFNAPRSHTVAGSVESIDGIAKTLSQRYPSLRFKRLNVSNAFHSTLVESFVPELRKLGEGLKFNKPTIRLERATETASDDEFSTDFVAKHLRNAVYFNHAIQRLAKEHPSAVWLEAGSNATVTSMASKALGNPKGNHFQAVNISGSRGLQNLIDASLSLWEAGLRVAYLGHSKFQTYDYATLSIPPYQFDRPKHWLELKEPPKLAAALASHAESQSKESMPTSLWTFTGYQDSKQRLARFRFNTMIPQYEEIVAGHTIAGTAPICPATVQIDVVIEAVRSLHKELSTPAILPQVRGVVNLVPICVDPSRSVWIDAEALDSSRRTWSWKMISTGAAGAAPTTHVTGEILFRAEDDLQYHLEFARYERLVSHKRCVQVLHSDDADEVIQGRSIYRVFSDVVDYGKQYFGLQKLVGKGSESAGRVVKKHSGDTWLDAFLSDAFCQAGGIWVNCMTERNPNDMYIANGIEQWVRSPKYYRDGPSQTEKWHVFGSHTRAADGNSFLSDLFIFDAKTEKLAEVILGINYAKVAKSSMGKLLSRLTAPGPSGATTFEPAPTPVAIAVQPSQPKKRAAADNSGLIKKLKLILADISGLEVEEIKEDVELGDIGVDSLMGMEMAREIETAFKCSLPQDDLVHVTNFPGLVKCVKSALGSDTADSSEDVTPDSSDASDGNGSGYSSPGSVVSESTQLSTPGEDELKRLSFDLELPHATIVEAFEEAKALTDKLIVDFDAQDYLETVIPKQDQFCVALTIEAFRELGCDIAAAKPGQKLTRIPHAPDQAKFAHYLYSMLEATRIVDLDDGITRTHIAVPSKHSSELLKDLNKNFPDHSCSNDLAQWTGSHLAGILTGKEDGIKLIFGTERGRELVSGVYADFPLNKLYYQQMGNFLANILAKVPKRTGQGPLKILEMGAGTGATTKILVPILASLGVPVEYTFTDLASSFVAAARKRFKQYPFMKYRVHDIEKGPADDLVHSQHVVIASNAIHATRSLPGSTENIRRMLRPDGLLMMLEMTQPMFWCDIIFGVFEGWWLFEDGRNHAVAAPEVWEKDLHSVGYGHVDWSDGHSPEVACERVIIATASGPQLERSSLGPAPSKTPSTWNHEARRSAVNGYVQSSTEGFAIPHSSNTPTEPSHSNVLITGATGSLGAHMVAHYAELPLVGTVFCLNRRSNSNPDQRQRQSLETKGIRLDHQALSKLKVFEVDTSKKLLGLSPADYETLASTVTHIVHNAWPMNAKRPVKGFELQFQVLRNLLNLSAEISARRPSSAKLSFQLISSIATVGHYPLHTGDPNIPEERMTIESVLPNGYGDAKYVCELMLDETLHKYPSRFRTMAVRLGQVAGSTASGYWNTMEHLSFLIKSSQTLRALPQLTGPLSWTPVDQVAAACAELALADNVPHPIYHIDNPVRQPWVEMLPVLAEALNIPENKIVAFEEWIRRVRAFPGNTDTENPAAKLVDFLEEDFRRMSCGGVLLGTEKSREHSETMRAVGPVSEEVARGYVGAWKESGFLFA